MQKIDNSLFIHIQIKELTEMVPQVSKNTPASTQKALCYFSPDNSRTKWKISQKKKQKASLKLPCHVTSHT